MPAPWLVGAIKSGVEIGLTIAAAYAVDKALEKYAPGNITDEGQERVRGKARDLTQLGIRRVLENTK